MLAPPAGIGLSLQACYKPAMKRIGLLLLVFVATGCSTRPIADVMDRFAPGKMPQGTVQPYGGVNVPVQAGQPTIIPAPTVPAVPSTPAPIVSPPNPTPFPSMPAPAPTPGPGPGSMPAMTPPPATPPANLFPGTGR